MKIAEAGGSMVFIRWALSTMVITAIGSVAFIGVLITEPNLLLALGAAVAAWTGVFILVWIGAPRFLGPTVLGLLLILVEAVVIVYVSFRGPIW